MAVLELDRLTLDLAAGGRRVALLRDISFAVEPGKTFGLVGESGAGKSMVGRLIAGRLPGGFAIGAGRLLFSGTDITAQPARDRRALLGRRIAFIPQEPLSALDPVLTVERQFAEHLARLGQRGAGARATILRWLEAVHLPDPPALLRRYPHELSGGQCQRVLIAMAFSSEPQLIVADEPTTALDVVTQGHVMRLLREQQRLHGAAVVLITHDLHLAAQICDEIGVLYAGDMVERGPAHAVLRDPEHPYTLALHSSVPNLAGPRRVLPTLPDQMPGVLALAGMPGCRFAPRCPARNAPCAASLPDWQGAGHVVRCAPACLRAAHAPPADIALAAPVASTSAPLLEFVDVSLAYRSRSGLRTRVTEAVRGVSLSIRPGEFVGLVGESGSGKSSIARLAMGLEHPTSGRILLDGNAACLRKDLQLVFQDPNSALNPRRSVYSLVTQALEAPGRNRTGRHAQALALLAQTGLPPDTLTRVPSQLSGGQKQRVNIARALCVTPRLLIADEIVSGLDVSVQAQVLNLLLQIGRDLGIALLLISHDLAVVRYLCTRVAVMHRGVIVETGPTESVFSAPTHAYTRTLLDAAA